MTTAPAPTIARPGVPPRDRPRRDARELAWLIDRRAQILASIAVAAIVVGGLLHAVGSGTAGDAVWAGAVALLAAELAFEVGRSIVVQHSLGVETIALVAMVGARYPSPGRARWPAWGSAWPRWPWPPPAICHQSPAPCSKR